MKVKMHKQSNRNYISNDNIIPLLELVQRIDNSVIN